MQLASRDAWFFAAGRGVHVEQLANEFDVDLVRVGESVVS